MSESAISVAIRTRPLLGNEVCPAQPITFHEGVMVKTPNKTFTYDFVFTPTATNQTVYNLAVANKIHNIFEGYNVTILAYGSTGSGKTFTMGTDYNPKSGLNSDMGVIPLGLNEIFHVLESEKLTKSFSVKVSFIEIYQEVIYDLCHPNAKSFLKKDPKFMDKNGPRIQDEKDGSCKVTNLTETPVNSIEEALAILIKGSSIRHTSATAKNIKSSRSHAIFTVYVEQQDKSTLDSKKAKFQLVDLAGSERMGSSKTQGISAKEGTNINVSLFCLSKVINALSDPKVSHIPYRESKLTRILQDSLGGNSHTVMIACVNPSSTSVEETLSTLRYADNTRNIKNRPKMNFDPPAVQIQKLKQQVEALQAELYKAQPMSHLNRDGNLNSEGRALDLLKSAYSDINDLNLKLAKVEEINSSILEKLKSIYETIKVTVAEITPVAAVDSNLKIYLEKLEKIQTECYLLLMHEIINSMEDAQNSSETVEEYESCESVLPMDIDEDLSDSSEEVFTPQKSEEDLMEELNGIAEKHQYSAKRLREIDIRMDLTKNIMECLNINFESVSEEEQADALIQKIQSLVKEKTNLETAMQKDQKYIVENQDKIVKYETDIKNLQDELRLVKKSLQVKDENKVKVLQLKKEMTELRKIKVKYMKNVKECLSASALIQKKKNIAILKLTREKNKKDLELSKMKIKCSNQIRVLESKYNQAAASKKALLQALQKKPLQPRTIVRTKQSQLSLEQWIEGEIKIKVCNTNVKADVESLEKDANSLKEQIKKIEELSPSEENKVQTNEVADLKKQLQEQLDHIDSIKNLPTDVDQNSRSCPWLDEIADVSEAKPLIEYLFTKCVGVEVESTKQLKISKENLENQVTMNKLSEVELKDMSTKIKGLEEQLEKIAWDHEQKTAGLELKHEAELLQIRTELKAENRSSLSGTASLNLKRSLDTQDYQEKFYRTQAELQKLQEELFKIKKGKRSHWLTALSAPSDEPTKEKNESSSQSMLKEYLDTEDDESFSNDPNDPDWRLTPAHKQKRPRLESKTAAESTIQVESKSSESIVPMETTEKECTSTSCVSRPNMPCKCEGGCKSKRCRCQRSKVSCSGACSCRAEKCFNIVDPSV